MKKLILVLLLVAAPCWPQEVKDVPKRKIFDKKFWFATAMIVGTTILDTESTARCLHKHTCREGNPIYGPNPSRARMYGIKAPMAAFTIWSTWWWKRDDLRKLERYQRRNNPEEPEPRIWEKPRSNWYVVSVIYSSGFGAAGIYNIVTNPKRQQSQVQPAQLSRNVTSP
jgi:hypothetical protein